jgi:hypothetical protein
MRGSLSVLAAGLLLALSAHEAPARQVVEVPVGTGLGRVGSVPGGGAVSTGRWSAGTSSSAEHVERFVAEELKGEVISEVGAGFRDGIGPDKEMLDRIWVVCPQTFQFLRELPERVRPQVARELVARAWTRRPLAAGFVPNTSLQWIPPLTLALDWRRQRFAEYGIHPDPGTDDLLLRAAKKRVLTHTPSIPAELHPVLIKEMSEWNLLTAVELFDAWPHLAAAILELPAGVRAEAIERLNREVAEAKEVHQDGYPLAADERLLASLTRLTAQLAQEQQSRPRVLAELAKAVDVPLPYGADL